MMILFVTITFSMISLSINHPVPQSLLDPSFDQFFDRSSSFQQQFQSFTSQQQQQQQQVFSPLPQQQSSRRLPGVSDDPTDDDEAVSVSPLDHQAALDRHEQQKQQLAEVYISRIFELK